MDEEKPEQQSTSILELMYLIRAKKKGEMSFAECLLCMSQWARDVIAEHEMGRQADAGTVNDNERGG